MATPEDADLPKHHEATRSEKLVIAASSLGTVFEWYDFPQTEDRRLMERAVPVTASGHR